MGLDKVLYDWAALFRIRVLYILASAVLHHKATGTFLCKFCVFVGFG